MVRLLSNYNITFNFVNIKELSLDEETISYLYIRILTFKTYSSINEVIETTDVLYMTRIQTERLSGEIIDEEYIKNNLYLTQEI